MTSPLGSTVTHLIASRTPLFPALGVFRYHFTEPWLSIETIAPRFAEIVLSAFCPVIIIPPDGVAASLIENPPSFVDRPSVLKYNNFPVSFAFA